MAINPGGPSLASPVIFDWLNGDIATLRADYLRANTKPMPDRARWMTINSVDVLEHSAAGGCAETAIVYFHGGGFIVGSPLTHADITGSLARLTRLPLYSVDYRLAPDFVAPAPIEDGLAVIAGLGTRGFRRFILCGDSAGAAIAFAVEAAASPLIAGMIAGLCGFYGVFEPFTSDWLDARGECGSGTDAACLRRYFDLATGQSGNPYRIAALLHRSQAPTYLMEAEDDPLRESSQRLEQALRHSGRQTTAYIAAGQDHGFLHGNARSQPALQALQHAADWIRGISTDLA